VSRKLREPMSAEEKHQNWANSGGHCLKIWPSQGKWINEHPNWIDFNCKKYNIQPDDNYAKCMAGKTIYVLGNSVARGYLFELENIMGSINKTPRIEAKVICQNSLATCSRNVADIKLRY